MVRAREVLDDACDTTVPVAGRTLSLRERLSSYHRHTRGAFSGFLMGVPLTVGYVLCILFGPVNAHERDFFINLQFQVLGETAYKAVQIGIAISFVVLIFVLKRKGRFRPRFFGPLVVEAMCYATLLSLGVWFGLDALNLTPAYPPAEGGLEPIVSALGESINQETVFRWILLEALLWILTRVFKLRRGIAFALGVLLGALIFATCGTLIMGLQEAGQQTVLVRFLTLGLAGAFFSILYYLRGYPACAYAHLFYATYWQGVVPFL